MSFRTEDQVRDESKIILGFDEVEKDIKQGTGQITTFNQLGFKGIFDKPDGWYLPSNINDVAIILETKSEKEDINKKKNIDELLKNIEIISTKYNKTIGILYNGIETKVYKNIVSCKPDRDYGNHIIISLSETRLLGNFKFKIQTRLLEKL